MARTSSSEEEEPIESDSRRPYVDIELKGRQSRQPGLSGSGTRTNDVDLLIPSSNGRTRQRAKQTSSTTPTPAVVSRRPRRQDPDDENDGEPYDPNVEVDELMETEDELVEHLERTEDLLILDPIEGGIQNRDQSLIADLSGLFPSSNPLNPIAMRSKASSLKSTHRQKGMPTVEITLLPLTEVQDYYFPDNIIPPSTSSRRRLLSPRSASIVSVSDNSEPSSVSVRALRPRWKTANHQRSYSFLDEEDSNGKTPPPAQRGNLPSAISSSDLGGYDTSESVMSDLDEDEDDDGSSSDGIRRRRITRKKGKGEDGGLRRSNRNRHSNNIFAPIPPDTFYGTSSNSKNRNKTRIMPTRSGRAINGSRGSGSTPQSYSVEEDESEEYISEGEEEVDELDSDSYSEESDYQAKKKGRGGAKAHDNKPRLSASILKEHKPYCEKCGLGPADELLEKALAKKRRQNSKKNEAKKRKRHEYDLSDEERARNLEGWLTCRRCVVSSHWSCLVAKIKSEVLAELQDKAGPVEFGRTKIRTVAIDEEAQFNCSRCSIPDACIECHEADFSAVPAKSEKAEETKSAIEEKNGDGSRENSVVLVDDTEVVKKQKDGRLMFRCQRCQQCVHYDHLKRDFDGKTHGLLETANYYQQSRPRQRDQWTCHKCREWKWGLDIIIAWRPWPADAKEKLEKDEIADYKASLPREYLIKWADRGFRHVTWVPHTWLAAVTNGGKLRNFLTDGPKLDLITDETLAAKGDDLASPTIANVLDADEEDHRKKSHKGQGGVEEEWIAGGPGPDPNAQAGLPIEWSTIDRIMDVMLLPPTKSKLKGKAKAPAKANKTARGQRVILSESASGTPSEAGEDEPRAVIVDGIEPPEDQQVEIDDWEDLTGRELTDNDVDEVARLVTWCYVKWDDLQYDQSTWDTPPPVDSALYPAFKRALKRYLAARNVDVPVLTPAQCDKREAMAARFGEPPKEQPDCVIGGKLMPFQLEGFQWLLSKYFMRESCILADDMGLGKTIQIASLLGHLGSMTYNIYPFLVVVPNSTITNWVREFEKWVPHLRVVPFYGEASSRKVIRKYELFHKGMQDKAVGLKAHVVLTTYDMVTGFEAYVFRKIPRWEMLVVDEGQRLKSDSNQIFKNLRNLNSVHRILLTGTPLNNNIRELFNLLNFLDPASFPNLLELETRFDQDSLNEGLIQELHELIKPYILRRIKADVLKLPPKIEIIVPISLTATQKRVYKSILEHHAEILKAMFAARRKKIAKEAKKAAAKEAIESVVVADDPIEVDQAGEEKSGADYTGTGDKDEVVKPSDDAVANEKQAVGAEDDQQQVDKNAPPVAVEEAIDGDDDAMEVDQALV